MTLLAVPITSQTTEWALADIERAVGRSAADAVEFRLDYMRQVDLQKVMGAVPDGVKVIVTARDPAEGGVWDLDDHERIAALADVARMCPDYLDIELATWRRCPDAADKLAPLIDGSPERPGQGRSCRLILSAHDFGRRPADLDDLLASLASGPCHVAKIVWQAESICDVYACFELMRSGRNAKPVIAIAMGEAGVVSRILAKKFGAFLSFGAIDKGAESAPGQIGVEAMKRLYRWDQIGADTAVYGVIGCPVMHSMSPAIHNAAMGECGVDGVYVPLRIEPGYENFEAFVRGAMDRPWMDLRGLSVTIPHKENALRFIDQFAQAGDAADAIEPLARQIGAVNTIVFDGPGELRGLNTDYAAALDALTDTMGCARTDLADVPVAVLGAGGASRAIVAGLRHCGCQVTIYNRTYSRAEALADEFDCHAEPLERAGGLQAKIVVNTTSLGMHPNVDQAPLPGDALRPGMVVFDNVYNPMETRLLREAGEVGCLTVSGVDMFVNQAVAQFEAWTGLSAPRELMRQVVVESLGSRDG